MKTVYSTKEGVKMNSEHDFGSVSEITSEFQFLMTTLETDFEAEYNYYFRITDDNYIQLANSFEEGELKIIAQYRLNHKKIKDNIEFILTQNIKANYLYDGLPTFKNSTVFNQKEFQEIVNDVITEKEGNRKSALGRKTELIRFLEVNNLYPKTSGNNSNSWIAKCPSGGNHFMQVVSSKDQWGCGYCNRKGKIKELKQWLLEIAENDDV